MDKNPGISTRKAIKLAHAKMRSKYNLDKVRRDRTDGPTEPSRTKKIGWVPRSCVTGSYKTGQG